MNYLHLCLSARLLQGDLIVIDRQLSAHEGSDQGWFVLTKTALIAAANLVDLERSVRRMYKEFPELATTYKSYEKQFEFAKYLRNKLVGHTEDRLLDKAIEWRPELLYLIGKDDEAATYIINLFILETAINTYVDQNGKHKVLDSETDLVIPDDRAKFLICLTDIVRGGIDFLAKLIVTARIHITEPPDNFEHKMILAMKAGKTEFKFLTKDRP
jgi:hypothetical protein